MTKNLCFCSWCWRGPDDDETGHSPFTAIAHSGAATGAGATRYACAPCMNRYRLLQLTEHPANSLGGVMYRQPPP